MLFAFGMPNIETLIFILVVVLVLFSSKRLRRAGNGLKHRMVKSFVPLKENNNKFR
jgi:Sec-independent protein translocase protein TatA